MAFKKSCALEKEGRIWTWGGGGEDADGFYVAFLWRIQFEGSCRHINAQIPLVFFHRWSHSVGVAPSYPDRQPRNRRISHPKEQNKKVSLESVTNSYVSVL